MKVLIADQKLVTEIFPMEEAIPTMRRALTMLAGGDVMMPLRTMLGRPQGDAVMGLMPSYLGGLEAVGVKVIAAFPANFGSEYDTHQGVVLFFDTERGLLRAIVDATSITAIRTAAVSGLATDLLARPDAGDLALIGAGTQAHTHLQAMRAVQPVRRVRVYSVPAESAPSSPSERRASRPAGRGGRDRRGGRRGRGPDLHDDDGHGAGRARRRVARARTSTRSVPTRPLRASSTPSSSPGRGCTPTSASRCSARPASSSSPSARASSGTTTSSARSARCSTGKAPARTSPDEVTLFKSLGIAIEDLASAPASTRSARSASSAPGSRSAACTSAKLWRDDVTGVTPYPEFFNDVFGPVMQPGSSSHTAGPCRLGYLAGCLLGEPVARMRVELDRDGSFAGTFGIMAEDRAMVAGVLGYLPDDARLFRSFELAEEAGVAVEFAFTEISESKHPNAVKFVLTGADGLMVDLVGDSTGGGMVGTVTLDGFPYRTLGDAYVVLVQDPQEALSSERIERLRAELPDVLDAQTVRVEGRGVLYAFALPVEPDLVALARRSTATCPCSGWRCCGRCCRSSSRPGPQAAALRHDGALARARGRA